VIETKNLDYKPIKLISPLSIMRP